MNTKEVRYGTKQEAVITPKPGHKLDKVMVINTADNQIIPSEVVEISDNPLQYKCSFEQPAGHVTIKTSVSPILYSVTIEENDMCNIVFVEQDSEVDVEIKNKFNEGQKEGSQPGFNSPQHSFNDADDGALGVGENIMSQTDATVPVSGEDTKSDIPSIPVSYTVIEDAVDNAGLNQSLKDNEPITKQNSVTNDDKPSESKEKIDDVGVNGIQEAANVDGSDEEDSSYYDDEDEPEDPEGINDVQYEGGSFEKELEVKEPVVMTQEEWEKKCELFWQWKAKFNSGECPEDKWKRILNAHNQSFKDIEEGNLIILE